MAEAISVGRGWPSAAEVALATTLRNTAVVAVNDPTLRIISLGIFLVWMNGWSAVRPPDGGPVIGRSVPSPYCRLLSLFMYYRATIAMTASDPRIIGREAA